MSTVDYDAVIRVTREKLRGRRDPYIRILQLLQEKGLISDSAYLSSEQDDPENIKAVKDHYKTFFEYFIQPDSEILFEYNQIASSKANTSDKVLDTLADVEQLTQYQTVVSKRSLKEQKLHSSIDVLVQKYSSIIHALDSHIQQHERS